MLKILLCLVLLPCACAKVVVAPPQPVNPDATSESASPPQSAPGGPEAVGPPEPEPEPPERKAILGSEAVALLKVVGAKTDCSSMGRRHVILEVQKLLKGPVNMHTVVWSEALSSSDMQSITVGSFLVGGISIVARPAKHDKARCIQMPKSDGILRDFVRASNREVGEEVLASMAEHSSMQPLQCSEPWSCVPSKELAGKSIAALTAVLGEPYWQSDDETVYAIADGCETPSRFLSAHHTGPIVNRLSFAWELRDEECTAKQNPAFAASSRPFHAVPCGMQSKTCATKELHKKSETRIVAGLGFPHSVRAGEWTYRYPRGCSEQQSTLRLRFDANDKVSEATWANTFTGKICM